MSRLARAAAVLVLALALPAVPAVTTTAAAADPLTVVDQVGMLRVVDRDGAPSLELAASNYDGTNGRTLDPAHVVVHVPSSALTTVPYDDFARDPAGEEPGPEDSFYSFLGPEGTPFLRTAADPAEGRADGNVVLGLAGSTVADGKHGPQVRLQAAIGGRTWLYQDTPVQGDPDAEPYRALNWDLSRPAGVDNVLGGVYGPDEQAIALGAFAAAGSYCLTMRPEILAFADNTVDAGPAVAMRVVVGDRSATELAATAPCAQPDPDDPGQPADPDVPTIFGAGAHVDVSGVLRNGSPLSLVLRKTDAAGGGNELLIPFRDAVVTVPDRARSSVPAPSSGLDTSFLGSPGAPTWRIPENRDPNLAWLGFGGELIKDRVTSSPALRITGVTGADGGPPPGELVVWNNGSVSSGAGPTFSTRQGLPQGAYLPVASHGHRNWDFSAAGVYCVGLDLQVADGAGTEQRDAQQLTVVVGDDVDPASVQPCGRSGRPLPIAVPARTPAPAAPGTLLLASSPDSRLTSVENRLTTSLSDGQLHTRIVRERPDGPGTAYDPDDVVFRALRDAEANEYPQAGPVGKQLHTFHQYGDGGGDLLGIDTLGVEAAQLTGRLDWAITGVRGPGRVAVRDAYLNRQILLASQAAPRSQASLVPGRSENRFQLHLDEPGVYCVDMSWSGRRASDGTAVRDTTTLTLVAGDQPASVTTCARGQQPTAPSTGGTTPTPTPPTTGGNRPDSGRTVLRLGHVDVRSDVTAAGLAVKVHDDTGDAADPAVDRDPAKVTFHAASAAGTSVPSAAAYRFLGAAGAPVWVLPQTQDERLLWPGWNVSLGDGRSTAVQWTLNSVRGPGRFALFESEAFGTPKVLLDGSRPGSSFRFSAHGHGNWAFGADGVYCLGSTFRAVPTGASRAVTLLVAVGRLNPATVTTADCGRTAAQVRALDTAAGRGDTPSGSRGTSPTGGAAAGPSSLRPPVVTQPERCLPVPVTSTRPGRATVVSDGHLDLGARLASGSLVAEIEDGRSDPPIGRDPASLVLDVGAKARQSVPAGYGFLGRAGAPVWIIPQTQVSGVPWLGWNTQDASLRSAATGSVAFALTGVSGPGTVAVYTDDVFGGVRQRVFGTAPGFPRATQVPLNVHAHANWAFTEPGTYRLALTQTAQLRSGGTRTATATLTVAVAQADPAASAPTARSTSVVGRTADGDACTLTNAQRARALASTGGDLADALATAVALLATASLLLVAGRKRRRA